jgi:hypothetical protein
MASPILQKFGIDNFKGEIYMMIAHIIPFLTRFPVIGDRVFFRFSRRKKMAIEKDILSRIINKHDIEVNWNKAVNFIPKKGEFILYDIDENYNYERIKVGDGITPVTNLPFYLASEINSIQEKLKVLDEMLDVEIDNNLNMLVFTRPLSI